jgi:DNA-binding transcriptional ArsR family regulator
VLRDAGLVADRRAGRWAFYSLRPEAVATITELLGTLHDRARTLPVLGDPCCA